MLQMMRRHAKYFYVLFVIVILTFIFWGVGRIDQPSTLPVATIGSERITVEEYWTAYDRALQVAKEVYKDKFDAELEKKLNLKKKVFGDLIAEHVLVATALKEGINVSDKEVADSIMNDPTFKREGVFSRDIYLKTLELNRLTPKAYEAAKRRELLVKKMISFIEATIELTPQETSMLGGDESARKQLEALLLEEKRENALRSYVEGLKKGLEIKINTDLIEG